MRVKEALVAGVLIALGITLIPVTASSAENVTPAGACKALNQKVVYQNKSYTCTKSGKKLIWSRGVIVAKPAPTSAPTSAPTATDTSTSAATAALETASPAATCSRNKNSLKNC